MENILGKVFCDDYYFYKILLAINDFNYLIIRIHRCSSTVDSKIYSPERLNSWLKSKVECTDGEVESDGGDEIFYDFCWDTFKYLKSRKIEDEGRCYLGGWYFRDDARGGRQHFLFLDSFLDRHFEKPAAQCLLVEGGKYAIKFSVDYVDLDEILKNWSYIGKEIPDSSYATSNISIKMIDCNVLNSISKYFLVNRFEGLVHFK